MPNDPLAGRDLRAPERCRMLAATRDGVFLWPGSALLARRGNGFVATAPSEINSHLGTFFGPDAIDLPLQSTLDIAADQLRDGRIALAQQLLDRLPLPPVSPNGARLMRAIALRQGLELPDLPVATEQSGTTGATAMSISSQRFTMAFRRKRYHSRKSSIPAPLGIPRSILGGQLGNPMAASFGQLTAAIMMHRQSGRSQTTGLATILMGLAIHPKFPISSRQVHVSQMRSVKQSCAGWCAQLPRQATSSHLRSRSRYRRPLRLHRGYGRMSAAISTGQRRLRNYRLELRIHKKDTKFIISSSKDRLRTMAFRARKLMVMTIWFGFQSSSIGN